MGACCFFHYSDESGAAWHDVDVAWRGMSSHDVTWHHMTLSLLAFYRRPGCSLGWGSVTEQLDSGEDYFQKMFIYVYLRLFTFIYVY